MLMKKFFAPDAKRNLLFLLAALILGYAFDSAPAHAQRSKGPSAIAAARLKNRPPQNWIRHYLGDDRYKIAGGIWKVVSTELDRYYYPAWAPEMLNQPAGIVIGFSSATEAEEAGYMASSYPMGESLYGLTPAEIAAAKKRAQSGSASQGTRILLADGVSSIIIPSGWRRVLSKRRPNSAGSVITNSTNDMFEYGNNLDVDKGFMILTFVPRDTKANMEREFSIKGARKNLEDFLKDPKIDQSVKALRASSQIQPFRLGGLPGWVERSAGDQSGNGTVAILAARGQKVYWFQMTAAAEKTPGLTAIINSFQPH